MAFKVGIDVGGTFTDFFVIDDRGTVQVYKSPTTPADPTQGVFNGLELAAADWNLGLQEFLGDVERIVHGTTITTNAALTGTGAKTGFVTTGGFRDVLNMRRGLRERQYDNKYSPPAPLVPRHRIAAVAERIDVEGDELVPLDEDAVRRAAEAFSRDGVEAVGVSFLWSFLDPRHEQRVRDIFLEVMPEAYVSLSSEVLPQIRAYERHSTTALNAYVGPPLARYLTYLEKALSDQGFGGVLLIMQSNGGVMSPDMASRFAVHTLLSGPAAGPTAGVEHARTHGLDDVITIDMGGTSFDAALVQGGVPTVTTDGSLAGYRVAAPMVDAHTVGAGGGSIAWIDPGGLLRVGPQSAGADPGPACYGRGGEQPTVTDADLLLGYLDADAFYGGGLTLDVRAAEDAVRRHIADPLGLDATEAAYGIHEVVNATMAGGVSVVSVQRGYDPREFALVVAGGAGPTHAARIAAELGIDTVLIPRQSSVFCAAGMLLTDLKHDYVRTYPGDVDAIDDERAGELLREMAAEAGEALRSEGVADEQMAFAYGADLRYIGQFNEVEVPGFADARVTDDALAQVVADFHRRHDSLYGYSMPGAPVELINLRLTATGRTDKPERESLAAGSGDASHARRGERPVYLDREWVDTPVYDGLALEPNNSLVGPAVIEQPTTTILLVPGYRLDCDAYGSYVMRPSGDA